MKTRHFTLCIILGLFSLALLTPLSASADTAAIFVVTTADDTDDGACTIKHCTLREAIQAANATKRADTIHFDISAVGPPPIRLVYQLPDIMQPVTIDGYSQPGASPNTLSAGSNAVLNIIVEPVYHPVDNEVVLTGLVIAGGDTTIRGLVIRGFWRVDDDPNDFHQEGVGISVKSSGNTIEGNIIGKTVTDFSVNSNYVGIVILGGNNVIGGSTPAARNVISGNQSVGIAIEEVVGASNNTVLNNYIGTDASGVVDYGNQDDGIFVSASTGLRIENNLISGNRTGIHLLNASRTEIYGNTIGTDRTRAPLPNARQGIYIDFGVVNATIGGIAKGESNRIFYNGSEGIAFARPSEPAQYARRVTISANKIGENGTTTDSRGILLQEGVTTPNDPRDTDEGANGLQNHPLLTKAKSATSQLKGRINTNPGSTVRIEFFESRFCDPSLYGEGEKYLGSVTVQTDADGDAVFTANVAPFSEGRAITATATSKNKSTSEFSPCFTAG